MRKKDKLKVKVCSSDFKQQAYVIYCCIISFNNNNTCNNAHDRRQTDMEKLGHIQRVKNYLSMYFVQNFYPLSLMKLQYLFKLRRAISGLGEGQVVKSTQNGHFTPFDMLIMQLIDVNLI